MNLKLVIIRGWYVDAGQYSKKPMQIGKEN